MTQLDSTTIPGFDKGTQMRLLPWLVLAISLALASTAEACQCWQTYGLHCQCRSNCTTSPACNSCYPSYAGYHGYYGYYPVGHELQAEVHNYNGGRLLLQPQGSVPSPQGIPSLNFPQSAQPLRKP